MFDNIGLDLTYCLPKNYSTELFYNGTNEKLGSINLFYCKVENDNECIDLSN